MPAAPEFTPLQMAVAATSAVVVLAVGFAGYQMGPSEHLTSARKKQAAAPRPAAASTVHAAPAATPAAASSKQASPAASAAQKKSPAAGAGAGAAVAQTAAAASSAPQAAQPAAKASKPKASKADALFASLTKAFKAAPANEAAPNITFAELEARVARIGSGLLASSSPSVVFVEWSPADEVLCTLALLAASWIGSTGRLVERGAPVASGSLVVGRGKTTMEAVEAFAGFCAPSSFVPGGSVDLENSGAAGERVLALLEGWVAAGAR